MTDLRTAAQQALEAWQTSSYGQPSHRKAMVLAMTTLHAALEHPMCKKHPRYSTYPLCPDCELEKEKNRRDALEQRQEPTNDFNNEWIPEERKPDLHWYALNYRTASTEGAQQAFDELQRYVEGKN